jgi:DnaJ-class molecular chaperone
MNEKDPLSESTNPEEEHSTASSEKCPACLGKGYIAIFQPSEESLNSQPVTHDCETCDGQGMIPPSTTGHLVLFSLLS